MKKTAAKVLVMVLIAAALVAACARPMASVDGYRRWTPTPTPRIYHVIPTPTRNPAPKLCKLVCKPGGICVEFCWN